MNKVDISVNQLISMIQRGELRLPEILRHYDIGFFSDIFHDMRKLKHYRLDVAMDQSISLKHSMNNNELLFKHQEYW